MAGCLCKMRAAKHLWHNVQQILKIHSKFVYVGLAQSYHNNLNELSSALLVLAWSSQFQRLSCELYIACELVSYKLLSLVFFVGLCILSLKPLVPLDRR